MRRQIAYVPQRAAINWDFPITVFDVVLMGRYGRLNLFKWASHKDKEAARKALDRLGILHLEKRQIGELSGGQQQRVFLARALVQEADLYLLDEPFAGVDKATEVATLELMHALKAEGKTLLMVHHDLATVKSYFDSVLLLNQCLIAEGSVDKVFHEDNIKRTYGTSAYLFSETKKLTPVKPTGMSS
jgi:manganese/zinc/iron transport system ATP- binding protein